MRLQSAPPIVADHVRVFSHAGVEQIPVAESSQGIVLAARANRRTPSSQPRKREAAPSAPCTIGDVMSASAARAATLGDSNADRQRRRYEALERARLEGMRGELLGNGWEAAAARPRARVVGSRVLAGLPAVMTEAAEAAYRKMLETRGVAPR